MWRINRQTTFNLSDYAHKAPRFVRTASKTSVSSPQIVGIRREDINVWERRAPIAPQHVKELRDKGIEVIVQPSTRRAYTMAEYENSGAIVQEDLTPASLIMAVKQVPIDILIPNKSYAFFSHTIKAQDANMPLLDAMLEKNIRIIDYERMVDHKEKRVAAFGKFAGVGGMINILHGLGLRLLSLGHHTPFMYVGSTHNYKNSRQARLSIYELGEDIRAGKLPSHFGPLTFVFTGSGNVSQGAQEVFQELPHVYVHPHELEEAIKAYDHRTLVATKVSRKHYLVPKGGGGEFDPQEFEEHPERYRSIFAEKIAPYASVIINGVYWAPVNPRLLTIADGKALLEIKHRPDKYGGCPELPHRLLALCDISADLGGSLEFMKECTTIEYPFALYNAEEERDELGVAGDGLLYCSIDNIPAQLPREATDYFGKLLLPWIPEMVKGDAKKPLSEETCYSSVTKGAIICSNGDLTKPYKYISDMRRRNEEAKAEDMATSVDIKHKVLVLGAGRVAAPLVEYLTRDPGVRLTTVSSIHDEVLVLSEKYRNTEPIVLDVNKSRDKLETLVAGHDLVISLLPYTLHPSIAKLCITHKKDMLTASYVSPEMKSLEQSAIDAGITIFQEIGLDPGIDHLLAMNCFDEVRGQGGKIVSFKSFCGGLPAPEHANNALKYKFSWSPRGALMTALNGARYLENGEVVDIAPGTLLEHVKPLELFPGFNLEGYPNRDSTVYVDKYGLYDVKTMLRGTMRYKNFSDVCQGLMKLGCLNENTNSGFEDGKVLNWQKIMNTLLGSNNLSHDDLAIIVYDKLSRNDVAMKGVQTLGLLSPEKEVAWASNPLDTLCTYLAKELVYEHAERDLILLNHEVGIEWPNGKQETRNISLVSYGDPDGCSAMARTVSTPAAIAARMMLDGEVVTKGNVIPLSRELYDPMLKRLSAEGIRWTTKSTFS
ncbi:alpha-aminoadipic semialdehyde synthase, mitochondrial-like [Hydractinia symbiolongicarpus]|uniref:alpha-aminoadipic semialdehyde synthase, mitochondrial-like n=1 Tax=Hydractinia symbiolongicarpus TaxID=13093 RepID=UPI00254FB6A1|nr:alpha-aminoadipic semialdehyde synthase, mitochondrial-like [Hydractinia symbiolongicarpus]